MCEFEKSVIKTLQNQNEGNMSKISLLVSGAVLAILLGTGLQYYTSAPTTTQKQLLTEAVVVDKNKAVTAASTDDSQYQNWHEFTPQDGEFKVLLPALPQNAKEKLPDPKTKTPRQYDMYVSSKDDGTIFMISKVTMDEDTNAKINENVLSTVIDDVVAANPQSKVKKMELGKYKGFPSLDFAIDNEQYTIQGKAFLNDHTLYMLTMVAKIALFKQDDFNFFVNSFDLTSSKK